MTIELASLSLAISGLIVALITAVALIIQIRVQRAALRTDALLQLEERFESDRIRSLRVAASRKLLLGKSSIPELSALLDFFASIAFLVKAGAIDKALAYNQFSWWVVRYWLSSSVYIESRRKQDVGAWRHLEAFVADLKEMEKAGEFPPESYEPPSMRAFLAHEAKVAAR